jgi:hypothetical protein
MLPISNEVVGMTASGPDRYFLDVRFPAARWGESGLVVLTLSFVGPDPLRTLQTAN